MPKKMEQSKKQMLIQKWISDVERNTKSEGQFFFTSQVDDTQSTEHNHILNYVVFFCNIKTRGNGLCVCYLLFGICLAVQYATL